jgi:hypothetical protein
MLLFLNGRKAALGSGLESKLGHISPMISEILGVSRSF